MRYSFWSWWSENHRKEPLTLCRNDLNEIFRIPCGTNTITVALHTTPAEERVKVRVITGDYGYTVARTHEHGVYNAWLAVPEWAKRAIRKRKDKPLYLEVSYEE